jgi:hypothetical protein
MEHPKAIGDRTTLAVMLGLTADGYTILLPFGENTRYDLVIDRGQTFARVQCKTGRLRKGAVWFATCSSYGHHRNPATANRGYAGEIDYFGIHCPDTGGVYLVPLEDVPTASTAALRIDPARNHQKKQIRLGERYEVGRVLLSARLRVSAGA